LGLLGEAHARMDELQSKHGAAEACCNGTQLSTHACAQALGRAGECFEASGPIGYHKLRSAGRRGCACIRDEVRDREIDFVPDARHDRNRGGADCARDALVVKGP
jgi:hypothetical protein